MMKAIILAGGRGSRLGAVTDHIPKPMLPIDGRPFLEYIITYLCRHGIDEIILSVGYKKEVIAGHFGTGADWGARITYSEEDQPLGTAGATKKAFSLVSDDICCVLNGDSFLSVDIERFISFHRRHQATATIALARVSNRERFGGIAFKESGEITEFQEKGLKDAGFINGGFYLLNAKSLNLFPENCMSLETDVFPRLLDGRLYGYRTDGIFVDIGIPEDYRRLVEDSGTFTRCCLDLSCSRGPRPRSDSDPV